MKVRNGFVSNSSTSSFVIVGVRLPEFEEKLDTIGYGDEYDEFMENLEEKVDVILYGSDDGVEGLVVGFVIAEFYDDQGVPDQVLDFSDLEDFAQRLLEDFDVKREDIKIYTGTRMC